MNAYENPIRQHRRRNPIGVPLLAAFASLGGWDGSVISNSPIPEKKIVTKYDVEAIEKARLKRERKAREKGRREPTT